MPYQIPWEESEPVGAITPAETIDTELQELKISVRERMDDLIGAGNWEDDNVDPKQVISVVGNHFLGLKQIISSDTSESGAVAFVEINNTGEFTNTGPAIEFVDDGTYLILLQFTANVVITGNLVKVTMTLSGDAGSITFPQLQWSTDAVVAELATALGYGLVIASAGEEIQVDYDINNAGSEDVDVANIQLMIMRIV